MDDKVRNAQDAKGRLEEAAGDVAGDRDLEREGKVDRAAGKAKHGIGKAAEKAKEAMDRD
jgi:uncharacterized protein YjbJ (UPF0337 family)